MTAYHPRGITGEVRQALENMPVVVLTGMRQTGKTTSLQSQRGLKDRLYLSFDDFAQLEAAKGDPDGFLRREAPVTIDEAQKCPEIFDALKRSVDRDRTPGRFLLSGSADFAILEASPRAWREGLSTSISVRSIAGRSGNPLGGSLS